jgi:hypothetical protein
MAKYSLASLLKLAISFQKIILGPLESATTSPDTTMGLSDILQGRLLRYAIVMSAGSCYLLFGYDQVSDYSRGFMTAKHAKTFAGSVRRFSDGA